MIRALPFMLVVLLAACAETPPAPPKQDSEAAWRERQETLAALPPWALTGRISIRTEAEAWHATLHWEQSGEAYEIRFVAPLGHGTVRLHGDSKRVTLQTAKDEAYTAATPEVLLRERLGWQVPVGGLRYWAVGLPAPDVPARREIDPQGRLVSLLQSGWDIAFRRYMRVGTVDLPAKIFMKNSLLEVRLVVDAWQFEGAARTAVRTR